MFPPKGMAYALVDVSIGIVGLAISMLGLALIQEGSTNINPYPVIGIFIALMGVVASLMAATSIKNTATEEKAWWRKSHCGYRQLSERPGKNIT